MKIIEKMSGYKATNSDMTCQGHVFELGKWYEHPGEIVLCSSGFHFCIHASGPSCYYGQSTMRLFKCEAEQILECPTEAGADFKLVAKRIRLTEEITPGMNQPQGINTGDSNTGDSNTGDMNTGDKNTGDCNTGNWNVCSYSSGFFGSKDPLVTSFDKQTKLTRNELLSKYPEAYRLGELLCQDEPIKYDEFKNIPGWTLKKCKALHESMIAARKGTK